MNRYKISGVSFSLAALAMPRLLAVLAPWLAAMAFVATLGFAKGAQAQSCSCSGTGLNGPVTVSCGETTCGTDDNTYVCNSPGGDSGWAYQSSGCSGGGDGGSGSCSCSGTGLNGPVTVSCGQTTCGTDDNTYVCNSPGGDSGWAYQSSGCSCSCSGTGLNGPVTVSCGETTCGTDDNTYVCNSPGGDSGWAYQSSGCSGTGDGGSGSCSCSGTGLNGPVTVSCGQTTCGTDDNTYVCNSPGGDSGWAYQTSGCAGSSQCVNQTFNVTGSIQQFTVTQDGTYTIVAVGGEGGSDYDTGFVNNLGGPGGNGGLAQGNFTLTSGTVLQIVVGAAGGAA